MAPISRRLVAPILEASLLRRSVDFLASRGADNASCSAAKVQKCIGPPASAPIDIRVSAATRTVFVSYDGGVEALEFNEASDGPPVQVSAIGSVPLSTSSPSSGAFWSFVTRAVAWIIADVTFDRDAQVSLLAPAARCFSDVGNVKIANGNAELGKTTMFGMPYPIVFHFEQRVVSWDFDIIDRISQEVTGRGTDVVQVSESGLIDRVDTIRHLQHQPAWVRKQIAGDPLAQISMSRVQDSILPASDDIPTLVSVPRPASQALVYKPYEGNDSRHHSLKHPAACGSSVPVFAFGPTNAKQTVIVMSEWWGVDSGVLDMARSLAVALGPNTRTVVPNFYRDNAVPVDVDWGTDDVEQRGIADAGYRMAHSNWTEVINDIEAVVSSSPPGPVALVGFSYGAVAALLGAQFSSRVTCVSAWYGSPDEKFTGGAARLFDASKVRIPVQLQWATEDKIVGFSDLAIGKQLEGLLPDVEFVEHRGDHGFLNDRSWWQAWKASLTPARPPYSRELAASAWAQCIDFLKKHLHGGAK